MGGLVSFSNMEAIKERKEFSKRLRESLEEAGLRSDSPAALAREFNRRYPGNPISSYGVRKWLMAEAIPSQDKLRVLAQLLKVSADWLRFGGQAESEVAAQVEVAPMLDYALMRAIADLSEEHQTVVRSLVVSLKKIETR